MPRITIEEARASGRVVEHESAGVVYTYSPKGSWINGHEFANPGIIERATTGSKVRSTTRSWLLAQCIWWGLWKADVKCPPSYTKADMMDALEAHFMYGYVLSVHPKSVWIELRAAWEEKFGDVEEERNAGREPVLFLTVAEAQALLNSNIKTE